MAWWNEALWVAHLDLASEVALTRVATSGQAPQASTQTLGLSSALSPSITAFGTQLLVAIAVPDDSLRLLASSDGSSFGAPHVLPFVSATSPSLGVATDMWLAWVDEGMMLHVARSADGINFSDTLTPFQVNGPPAIVGIHEPGGRPALALAWLDRSANAVLLTVFDEESFGPQLEPRISLGDSGVANVAVAFATGHKGAASNLLVACERFDPPQTHARDNHLFARQVSRDLTSIGEPERLPYSGLGPCLVSAPGRLWAAWRDMGDRSDSLVIAPYDAVFELPDALRALIGQPCTPKDCPPDLRLACVATEDFEWHWDAGCIRNALKGDLVVTPADGVGIIGGFLKMLKFEQRFDHMGIMVDDHYTVRHTTMAHGRLKNYVTGSILGEPAPVDGFRQDTLKYGWPGTITQTVQNAFFDGFNDGANPQWSDPTAQPPPAPPAPPATAKEKDDYAKAVLSYRGFIDPERHDGYAFANMTWTPQLRLNGEVVVPIVVKPPALAEARDPEVRATLHRVAEAAKTICGHYRFYAYTEGPIGRMAKMAGPPPGDPAWQGLPPGADWAAGTDALVCSTYIWSAVLEASRRAYPELRMEGQSEATAEEVWKSQVHVIYDGLYRYHSGERSVAAQALYDHVVAQARSEVWSTLMKLKSDFDWLATILRLGLATVLSFLAMPVGALAALLGIRIDRAGDLLLWLNEMPDSVANQIVNAFASDQPEKIDDDFWKNAGEGVSVAPHDIVHLWDPPTMASERTRVGLWGNIQKMILPEPHWERRRKHVYARSNGLAEVTGVVRYRGSQEPIVGAVVRIGCETTQTGERGDYQLKVAAGIQELNAGAFWPASEWWLAGVRVVDIRPGGNPGQDIELEDPPEWRRVLQIRVKLDLVNRVYVGNDDWKHATYLREHRFTHFPVGWGEPPGGAPSLVWDDLWGGGAIVSDYAGEERARLRVKATLNPDDLSIALMFVAEMIDGHEAKVDVSTQHSASVAIDMIHSFKISMKTAAAPPERAWFEIDVLNLREMA
ncbi:hypothetical protein D7Y27_08860 [Corallococcus sp. AB004]|nr:hypothetical protein D7Y27_08860 [Corallococcus sp. AB004]